MNCKKYDMDKLNMYIDGELSADEIKQIELHMSNCSYCRDYVVDIRSSVNLIKKSKNIDVPASLWQKIQKSINFLRKERLVFKYVLIPAVAAVSLLIFINQQNSTLKNKTDLNEYIGKQLSYLNGESMIDNWYIEDNNDLYIVDMLLDSEI